MISTATLEAWNTNIRARLSTAFQAPSRIDIASQDDVRRADVKQEDRVKRMKPLQAAGSYTYFCGTLCMREINGSFKSWEGADGCIAVRHIMQYGSVWESDSRLLKTMLQHMSQLMSAWAWIK